LQPWKTLSRRTILAHSKYLSVQSHTVELPDGQVISDWPWVVTREYVIVLATTQAGKFLCFRQTKYGVKGTSLAVVGGYIEAGEEPIAAAKRELLEETGYQAPKWSDLGNYRVDGNHGAGRAYLFLAREARCVGEANADDLEEQKLLLLNRSEVERALADGEFKVLAWTTAVAMALLRIGS
jgi:ADP-ribose pyrophosphatase